MEGQASQNERFLRNGQAMLLLKEAPSDDWPLQHHITDKLLTREEMNLVADMEGILRKAANIVRLLQSESFITSSVEVALAAHIIQTLREDGTADVIQWTDSTVLSVSRDKDLIRTPKSFTNMHPVAQLCRRRLLGDVVRRHFPAKDNQLLSMALDPTLYQMAFMENPIKQQALAKSLLKKQWTAFEQKRRQIYNVPSPPSDTGADATALAGMGTPPRKRGKAAVPDVGERYAIAGACAAWGRKHPSLHRSLPCLMLLPPVGPSRMTTRRCRFTFMQQW